MSPRRAAIGRSEIRSAARLRLGQGPWMTVVGVVKDIRHDGLDVDGIPHIYTSMYQAFDAAQGVVFRDFCIVLRTSLPASALEQRIRHEVQSLDPGLPVYDIVSMDELLDRSLASRRFSAQLVGGFAGVALILASIGIYGVLAYMVGQRSREIGLRMALGATRRDILKLILRKGAVLAGIGVAAGVILSASRRLDDGQCALWCASARSRDFSGRAACTAGCRRYGELHSSPARHEGGPGDRPQRSVNPHETNTHRLAVDTILTAVAWGQGTKAATPIPTIASTVDREVGSVEKQVLEVAEAMPEDKLGVRTFALQVKHIAASNYLAIWSPLTGENSPRGFQGRGRPGELAD